MADLQPRPIDGTANQPTSPVVRDHASARPIPNLHDIDLKLLRIFYAVGRNSGFAPAQVELNIALSSISDAISRLESRFGVTLCERGRSGFRLTQNGKEIFDATCRLFQDIDFFRGRVANTRNELTGRVHLGIVDGIATLDNLTLLDALEGLEKEAPLVTLEMKVDTPQSLIGGVQNGRFDAVVIPMFRKVSGVDAIPLRPLVRQVLYCGQRHKLYGLSDEEISAVDIEKTSFAARRHMEGWLFPGNLDYNNRAWTNDMECLATLILTGRYIGYLPEPLARVWVDRGQMRAIWPGKLSYVAELFFVTQSSDVSNATLLLKEKLTTALAAV